MPRPASRRPVVRSPIVPGPAAAPYETVSADDSLPPDPDRRFGGIARLYGRDGLAGLRAARVAVVGVGGVGSWAVEALARSAVGGLRLIDLDAVHESNVNRQLPALDGEFGRAKVDVLAARIARINPDCRVETVEDFLTPDNAATLLDGCDAVVDAIDQVRAKAALIACCRDARRPLVVSGGAGGKRDPGRARVSDLARTEQDPMLAKLRQRLRKDYGFPRDPARRFGIDCVWSPEPLMRPAVCAGDAGLNCAGYGASMCVTATFGLLAAARLIERLTTAAGR